MNCTCQIVPRDVLDRLAGDKRLSASIRRAAANTARISTEIRKLRIQAGALTSVSHTTGAQFLELASTPKVTVYDCRHTQTLPGSPVAAPAKSKDKTATRAFKTAGKVAEFYKKVFNRNSVDNAGMTLMSSIHYGVEFNNALWNGTEMLYGDGDLKLSSTSQMATMSSATS